MALSSSIPQRSWREVRLWRDEALRAPSTASAIVRGHSILELHSFATPEECAALNATAVRAAKEQLGPSDTNGLFGMTRLQNQDLDEETGKLCGALAARLMPKLAHEIPDLAAELFGSVALCGEAAVVEFAPYEPALNVYGLRGEIGPHEDGYQISLLVPLSPHDDFTGGGTGFWSDERYDPLSPGPPTVVVRPPPGTAIVFAGNVVHSAHIVETGVRCCYVATWNLHEEGWVAAEEEEDDAIM